MLQVVRRLGDNAGDDNGLRLCKPGAFARLPASRLAPVPPRVARMRHGRRGLGGYVNAGLFSSQDGGGAVGAVLDIWRRHCNGVRKKCDLATRERTKLTAAMFLHLKKTTQFLVGSLSVACFVVGGRGINFVLLRFLHRRMPWCLTAQGCTARVGDGRWRWCVSL